MEIITTHILDCHDTEWKITAEVDGIVEYAHNPNGLESDHPYHGHQAGFTVSNLEVKNIVLTFKEHLTMKIESMDELPGNFDPDAICEFKDECRQALIKNQQHQEL